MPDTKPKTKEYKDLTFDDVTDNGEYGLYSQICQHCKDSNDIPDTVLSIHPAYATCGVERCYNNAKFYIDFPE